jgi:hypothetical protein
LDQNRGVDVGTMEDSGSITWLNFLLRVAATGAGLLLAFVFRRTWNKATKEYDRSILIRLGTDEDSPRYAHAPVIVGRIPFNDLGGQVRSNLDVRDVIGFVVGEPIWMEREDLKRLRVVLNPEFHKPGYYAYCVIQWEHAAMVRRFADQWFHIRRTGYTGNRAEPNMRERIFIGFSTDATPDADGGLPMVAHIDTGLLASFRYQPYLRGGFRAEDIKMRALAPQTKGLILCKDLFTKEWRNA